MQHWINDLFTKCRSLDLSVLVGMPSGTDSDMEEVPELEQKREPQRQLKFNIMFNRKKDKLTKAVFFQLPSG